MNVISEDHLAARDAEVAHIADLMADADRADAMGRHPIAQAVVKLHTNAHYGDGAMKVLAERMGLSSEASIHPYRLIGGLWATKTAFRAMVEQTNVHGQSPSWSHLAALARVGNTRVRGSLHRQMLKNCWTVQELRRACRECGAVRNGTGGRPRAEHPQREALSMLLKKCLRRNASDASRTKLATAINLLIETATADQLDGLSEALEMPALKVA